MPLSELAPWPESPPAEDEIEEFSLSPPRPGRNPVSLDDFRDIALKISRLGFLSLPSASESRSLAALSEGAFSLNISASRDSRLCFLGGLLMFRSADPVGDGGETLPPEDDGKPESLPENFEILKI